VPQSRFAIASILRVFFDIGNTIGVW